MMRVRSLLPVAAIAILFCGALTPGRVDAADWAVLFKTIGESAAVKRAIEKALGGTEAARLLSLTPLERGMRAFEDSDIASKLLSSGALTNSQQLGLASAINTYRLSESPLQAAAANANHENLLGLAANEFRAESLKRTWSISPIGDLKPDPSLKVPLFNFKNNQVQIEVPSIPTGKIGIGAAAAGTACLTASCTNYMQDYLSKILK